MKNGLSLNIASVPTLAPSGVFPSLALNFLNTETLSSLITFTRASSGTRTNSAGTLVTMTDNQPRFDYDPVTLAARGLLIEEQRTNSIRNNTMVGAVAGTPGTAPTNWAVSTGVGITRELVGTGTENGITYIDYRFSGTGAVVSDTQFEQANIISAASGQTWTHSGYFKVQAGSLANITLTQIVSEYTSAGAFLAASTQNITPNAAGLAAQRFFLSRTLNNALTNCIAASIRVQSTGAIDVTLRIGLPQLELGAFATSVIPTTTAAATRAADNAVMTGTNFSSWYNATKGTIVAKASVGAVLTSGFVARTVASIGRSTATALDLNLLYQRASDGRWAVTINDTTNQLSYAPLGVTTTMRSALAYKLNDSVAAINGTSGSTDVACTIPSSLTTLYLGNDDAGTANLNGWLEQVAFYPTRLPNATVQALTV
jgi:hypothetical protein